MRIEVLTVGDEILRGDVADNNFTTIARLLSASGLALAGHRVLPDDEEALAAGFAEALARGGRLIVTGGLGATPDDRTRAAIARALGVPLLRDEALAAGLRAWYAARGRSPDPALERMAVLPAGAGALPNPVGVAPGLQLRAGGTLLFALPGVPREMEAMLQASVLPELLREAQAEGTLASARLRTVGVGENQLAERIEPLCAAGVRVAYLPAAGRVDLRFTAASAPAARAALAATLESVRAALGERIYAQGDEDLAAVVLDLLRARGRTLAAAESLTGGGVGEALTRVPGSSDVFLGDIVAYHNELKLRLLGVPEPVLAEHGAVSAETAAHMAIGARRACGASVAVATTGVAGPAGGSEAKPVGLVWFALAGGEGFACYRRTGGGDRVLIQDRAVTTALDLLRLDALGRLELAGPPGLAGSV